ncbi:hypothetical protein G6F37_008046 [Rhizopus arrhizus]|nr:hypothetical protein G6F38_006827 [Rhizopus arrhizus]KAG1155971.1 hypothetical protein G6F37_008046 [Rhizopus arrhizus]
MSLDEFQQTLVQQTATRKATRVAINRFQRKRHNGTNNQSHFPPSTDNSFFRQGPSSQQGGLNSNIFSPSNAHYSNSTNNNNNYHRNNSNKKTSNPFRQQQLHNQFVNNIIQYGYSIPFHTPPPITTSPVPIIPYSIEQQQMIDKAIQDVLLKSAIEPVTTKEAQQTPGFYSSIFAIPKKNGGIRPAFNLKRLN